MVDVLPSTALVAMARARLDRLISDVWIGADDVDAWRLICGLLDVDVEDAVRQDLDTLDEIVAVQPDAAGALAFGRLAWIISSQRRRIEELEALTSTPAPIVVEGEAGIATTMRGLLAALGYGGANLEPMIAGVTRLVDEQHAREDRRLAVDEKLLEVLRSLIDTRAT